jgi:hypothetical protein
MSDIEIVNDEFGRPHPVKVEDLFQYGLESDGDTIATGVLKVKHVVFEQSKDADNVGQGRVAQVDFVLPPGSALYRYAWRTDRAWTNDGSEDYANLHFGTTTNFNDILDNEDAVSAGNGNSGGGVPSAYNSMPDGETLRVTIFAPAEHPDYEGGRTWLSFWYSVPTDTIGSDSPTWVID